MIDKPQSARVPRRRILWSYAWHRQRPRWVRLLIVLFGLLGVIGALLAGAGVSVYWPGCWAASGLGFTAALLIGILEAWCWGRKTALPEPAHSAEDTLQQGSRAAAGKFTLRSDPPFVASRLPASVQRLLFALAYWMAAADKQLAAEEQAWLDAQFGEEYAQRWLEEFAEYDDESFFDLLHDELHGLNDEQRAALFPRLKPWLVSLARADNLLALSERIILGRILKRLHIQQAVRALKHGPTWKKPLPDWPQPWDRGRLAT